MIYLESFAFPDRNREEDFLFYGVRQTCYTTEYPFNVFRYRELPQLEFAPITVLYGTNGSGKSTILNVIAEKLRIPHRTVFNKSNFFDDYVRLCRAGSSPRFYDANLKKSQIITSDDVFDYLIDVRHLNEGIDRNREELFDEYAQIAMRQQSGYVYQMKSINEYEVLKKHEIVAKERGQSDYVRRFGVRNIDERSNGEEALRFFTEQIKDHALYLLDEPENSLSAENQMKLRDFIVDSARFYGCQFIISSHSPFFLSMDGANVYDLDATPPREQRWVDLPNVRAYHALFEQHRGEFV